MTEVSRRTVLAGLGAGAGWLVARGLGVPARWEPPEAGFSAALRALGDSLTDRQRALVVLPADHPTRQITNTIAVLDRPHLGTLLSPRQQQLARTLCAGLLSERGRADFAATFAFEGRFEGAVLAVYGDPRERGATLAVSGGHLLIRGSAGDAHPDPFGGPVAYGQQVGNGRFRVEGNAFAAHGDAANRLYATLPPDARSRAVLPRPPHELLVQAQSADGAFPGVRVGGLPEPAREAAAALLDTVLGTWPEAERRRAHDCIAGNGGVDALHFATYATKGFYPDMKSVAELDPAERARRGEPYWQVWRLEGPGSVIHFKGHPHVHAYVNVVRDPARARVGERLGFVRRTVEGESMRALLEGALRRATGEALAWHPDAVPGRFCPGDVTTGLAYALDPYGNRVAVATLAGRAMAAPLRERLRGAGARIEDARTYRVAIPEHLEDRAATFGEPDAVEADDLLLRDALVAHLRAGGLGAVG